MMERPMLGQLLNVLLNSDRIVIYDGESEKSPELYRGFVGCFNNENIDTKRRIAKTGIGCEIFRIEKQDFNRFARTKKLGEPMPVEKINNFKYQDMEEIIYTRIFLEVRTAAKQET